MEKKAYTVFATHYTELNDLSVMYPHVKNVTLRVEAQGAQFQYLYKVEDGEVGKEARNYGIYVAG